MSSSAPSESPKKTIGALGLGMNSFGVAISTAAIVFGVRDLTGPMAPEILLPLAMIGVYSSYLLYRGGE